MALLYKSDWDETKERFHAWWAGETFGRSALEVRAPRDDVTDEEPPRAPDTPLQRWTDLDYIAALNDYRHRRTFFGGEAFPVWSGGYPGHTAIATFLGCEIALDMHTGWWYPVLNDEEWRVEDLRLNEDHTFYRFQISLLQRAVEEAEGRSIPSIGAFGGTGDTLAAVRGTDRLLFDVLDRPDLVRETELHLAHMWNEVYQAFYDIISPAAEGSTCWFRLWAPGKFYATQNDFSYMISPKTWRDVFLPALEVQLDFLDYAIHHVDGIEAFAHVPTLCELPRLQAIQILPGAGKPSPLHYMDVLKQVQAAGKNLHITIPSSEVETALRELSARGLFLRTTCETESEARDLLRRAETWSHD